jgi:hypothetical protein
LAGIGSLLPEKADQPPFKLLQLLDRQINSSGKYALQLQVGFNTVVKIQDAKFLSLFFPYDLYFCSEKPERDNLDRHGKEAIASEIADGLAGNGNGFFTEDIPEDKPADKNLESAEQAYKDRYILKGAAVRWPEHEQHKNHCGSQECNQDNFEV